jgi:hypothetical protein
MARRFIARGPLVLPTAPLINGVTFDGSSDYLTKPTTTFTGLTAGRVGLASFWFRMNGDDGGENNIFAIQQAVPTRTFVIVRQTANQLTILGRNAAGSDVLNQDTTTSYTVSSMAGNYAHALFAWDVNNSANCKIYVNDADVGGTPTVVADDIDYPAAGGGSGYFGSTVGARVVNVSLSTFSFFLHADIAQLYINLAEWLDITNVTNRRKFITAGGLAVNLGTDGSIPTGNKPTVFCNDAVTSWHLNKNTVAGGFTLNGTLTDAPSNPPE